MKKSYKHHIAFDDLTWGELEILAKGYPDRLRSLKNLKKHKEQYVVRLQRWREEMRPNPVP